MYPWCYPLGTPPVECDDGVVAADQEAIVLFLRSTNAMMDARGSLVINSTLRWRSPSPTGLFGALVGSHHGVADDGMILLMLEAYSEEVAYISLWGSDEQWIRVMDMRIPIANEHTASGPRYFVKLGMEISHTFVDVDLGSRPLLRMYRDGILPILRPNVSIFIPHVPLTPYGDSNVNESLLLDLNDHEMAPNNAESVQSRLKTGTRVHEAG